MQIKKVRSKQSPTRLAASLSSFGSMIADSYRAQMKTENIMLMLKYIPNMPNSSGEKTRVNIGEIKNGMSWAVNVPADNTKMLPDVIFLNSGFKLFFPPVLYSF